MVVQYLARAGSRAASARRTGDDGRRAAARMPQSLIALAAFIVAAGSPTTSGAQATGPAPHLPASPGEARAARHPLDTLVARALDVSPRIRAERERVRAADARVVPAGARPDPMLMAGIQNFPVTEPGFSDFMTMKMIGVSQTIPAGGKLASARRAAEFEAAAARAQAAAVALEVQRDVRSAYFGVAYLDQALDVIERTRDLLVSLIRATETRYEVGMGGQEDILRARVDAARLGEEASMLDAERRGAVAQLNMLLDRSTEAPLAAAEIPPPIARAAVAVSPDRITFVSPALGSRVAGSPIPSVDSLASIAVRQNPVLVRYDALIAAQAARAELARLERRPDIDVSLQYGQRDGFSDMVTAMVSIPLRLRRSRVQDPLAAAALAEVTALEAERQQQRLQVRARVATLHAELERARTQLALLVKAVLPQSRAAIEAALASYQAGRTEFTAVLDAQATLFNSETAYFRALSDFAKTLAELEQVVGTEILP